MFPDDCRICGAPLRGFTRVPVCAGCLSAPEPLDAEWFCMVCKTPFQNRYPLDDQGRCGLCRAGQRGFDEAFCFGFYEGALRSLIHLFKYAAMRPLARPLANLLMAALPRDRRFDAVVPMPLHWRRRWQRGFNQSELLARQVARRTGIPLRRLARRARGTAPQAGLSNSARRRNVAGAFRGRAGARGLDLLLVDDVMTTGSTASACALALRRAGARSVTLLTLARADRRLPVSAHADLLTLGAS
ncbi:MAG: ComF family protein [Bryobacteraceae bacterium]